MSLLARMTAWMDGINKRMRDKYDLPEDQTSWRMRKRQELERKIEQKKREP